MTNSTGRRSLIVATVLIGTLWFIGSRFSVTQTDVRYFYFGTVIEIRVYSNVDPAPALNEVEDRLRQWHQRFHAWQPSELTALNAALQRGDTVIPADDLADIIKRSQQLAKLSRQLFNPALGKRIALWGFARDNMNAAASAPTDVDPLTLPSMDDLIWQGKTLRSRHPDLQLDLGGIAKGYALEHLMALLKTRGFNDAMVNIGGDIGVLGQTPQRPWQIAIRDPDDDTKPLAILTLNDGEMVFTSGTYARQHDSDKGKAHHIIDPRTGAPSTGNRAVTVVGRDGLLLQAMCKALLIAGDEWPHYAKPAQLTNVFVVLGDGKIAFSRDLRSIVDKINPTWDIVNF